MMIVIMKVLEDGSLKTMHKDREDTITRRYCIEHIFDVGKEKV